MTYNSVSDNLKIKKINDEILYIGSVIVEVSENPSIMSSPDVISQGFVSLPVVLPFLSKEYTEEYKKEGVPRLMTANIKFQTYFTHIEGNYLDAYNAIQLKLKGSDLSETQCIKLLNKLVSNKPSVITAGGAGSPELTMKNIPEVCAEKEYNIVISYGFNPARFSFK